MNEPVARPLARYPDSVKKTIEHLAWFSLEPITYQTGNTRPHTWPAPVTRVVAGASLWRTFVCTPGCVACCLLVTRDYFEGEEAWKHLQPEIRSQFTERTCTVNGRPFPVFSVGLYEHEMDKFKECQFLTFHRPEGGLGCGLWPYSPLQCAISPQIQINRKKYRGGHCTYITKKGYSRGWRWSRKPQCQFHAQYPVILQRQADLNLLKRLREWANYFQVKTVIDEVINKLELWYVETSARDESNPVAPISSLVLWGE